MEKYKTYQGQQVSEERLWEYAALNIEAFPEKVNQSINAQNESYSHKQIFDTGRTTTFCLFVCFCIFVHLFGGSFLILTFSDDIHKSMRKLTFKKYIGIIYVE